MNGSRLDLDGYKELVNNFTSAKVDIKKISYENVLKSFKVVYNFLTFKMAMEGKI